VEKQKLHEKREEQQKEQLYKNFIESSRVIASHPDIFSEMVKIDTRNNDLELKH
jgi:hypothetical protein